ncbi:MAG: hypothetical protein IPK04_14780 [Bdellovibrionales bacterium]|nr:hypothetical protein [Bdellovibrionales bacterium]
MEQASANKKTVELFFQLFSSGQATEAFALVAPDVTWWVPESLPLVATMIGQVI